MPPIGPRAMLSQQATLFDLVNDYGGGIMSGDGCLEPPKEVVEFCYSQYERFSVLPPPEDVVYTAACATLHVVDTLDPYALLCGTSDVQITDDWQRYTYEIINDNNEIIEADPELLETFVSALGQDEDMFRHHLARPGLHALPYALGEQIDELAAEYIDLEEPTKEWLKQVCAGDDEKYQAYFQLSAWATFLWIAGPPGREFRQLHHDVFFLCARDGEAIIYDGCFLGKDHYRRLQRPAQSCHVCGLDSWCVELVHVSGVSRYLCEKHLNGAMPLYGRANCGSRFCKYSECQHHPEHGRADAMHRIMSNRGQLVQLVESGKGFIEGPSRGRLTT